MLIGHYGAGFLASGSTPRLKLWVLVAAVQAVDVLWVVLVIVGVERASVDSSLESMPLRLEYMPYSHAFTSVVVWSALIAALHVLVHRRPRDRGRPAWSSASGAVAALVVAAAVFSHWALDLVVHREDLPLYGDRDHVGWGLWDRPVWGFVLEVGIVAVGLGVYLRATRATEPGGSRGLVALTAFLLVVQAALVFGPTPGWLTAKGAAASVLVLYVAVTAAAWYVGRRREWADRWLGAADAATQWLGAGTDAEPLDGHHREAIVIGTGFGGAISACRLAGRWGDEVLVLERGKRYGLGSFPRSPRGLADNFWTLDEEPRARPRFMKGSGPRGTDGHGLFDVRAFRGIDAVVAAGVGGGSLIYANVFLEPPDRVFDDDRWPASCSATTLAQYYKVAREVLGATPVPATRLLPRTRLFRETADAMDGRRSELADVNVFFGDPTTAPGQQTTNRYGAIQTACTHCGECDIGCNIHAKNTVDLNYLHVAETVHGATILAECLAEKIVPLDAHRRDDPDADGTHGYRVYFHELATGTLKWATANRVVVSAGTFGTNELLLRCRDVHGTLPRVGSALGTGFSGNGDFLAFVVGTRGAVDPNAGPVITQYIDFDLFQGSADRSERPAFVLEDGGYPALLAWFVEGVKPAVFRLQAVRRLIRNSVRRLLRGRRGGTVGFAARDVLSGDLSHNSAVLLAVGIDRSTGVLSLDRNGRVTASWPVRENRALYRAIVRAGKDFKKESGAKWYLAAPTWRWPFRRAVTVHPLGGCRPAHTQWAGVVDADPRRFGEVFGHRNLFVADGAIVPTAVGANPVATISALSEMVCHGITGSVPDATLGVRLRQPVPG